MKKFLVIFMLVFLSGLAAAQVESACNLGVTLINQDPYPAVPGDIVKIVFQVEGVQNPACGTVRFNLIEEFPFSLEPGKNPISQIQAGTYTSSQFKPHWLVPYKLIIDETAVDGENTLRAQVSGNKVTKLVDFNITIENLATDFEVSIRDYVAETNTLTFEILNIGEGDVEALTVEIPKQDNIEIKGSNRNIIGSLDSNDDTTFNFEAIPSNGEIKLNILYTDQINIRRSVEKIVTFDSAYFEGRARDQEGISPFLYIVLAIIIIAVIWWWRRRIKRKRRHSHTHHHS